MLNSAIAQTLSIKELTTALTEHITELGYRPKTIQIYSSYLRRLVEYCEFQSIEIFTIELGGRFAWECYGMVFGDTRASRWVNRVIRALADFQKHGKIFKRPSSIREKEFSIENKSLFEGTLESYRAIAVESSVKKYHQFLLRFEQFLKDRGVMYFNQLEIHHVNAFIDSLADDSRNTVRTKVGNLRKLFDYARDNGYHHLSFSDALPAVTYRMRRRLPETFTPDEIELILESINRHNPIGKRNYAIMIIIARLGLRISDVFGLRYDSINWQSKTMSITQQKTGIPLDLPLPEDVGWAVIDYLKNGRPESNCEHIFIRHSAPYDKMVGDFTKITSDAIQKAGIKPTPGRTTGTHSLRYSIATSMLNQGTTLPEIAQILGHTCSESTEQYIRLSVDTLKQCALEVNV